jgi:hypothetical protein
LLSFLERIQSHRRDNNFGESAGGSGDHDQRKGFHSSVFVEFGHNFKLLEYSRESESADKEQEVFITLIMLSQKIAFLVAAKTVFFTKSTPLKYYRSKVGWVSCKKNGLEMVLIVLIGFVWLQNNMGVQDRFLREE